MTPGKAYVQILMTIHQRLDPDAGASGVTILDVSPRAMTAAVVNRYLEIKARGAL